MKKKDYNPKKEEEKKKEKKLSEVEETLKKMEATFESNKYIVVDWGTNSIKMGLSGQDYPRVCY
jgi:hypothetical protein